MHEPGRYPTGRVSFKVHQANEPFQKFVAEIVPNLIDTVVFLLPFGNSVSSIVDTPDI